MNGARRASAAIADLQRALAANPESVDLLRKLGTLARLAGNWTLALDCFRKAVALKPDGAGLLNNCGIACFMLGRPAEAEACYRKVLRLKPDHAEAHNNLGNALRQLGRSTDAEASYRRALALRPDCAEMHNNLGTVLRESGHLADAEACFREALRLKPDYAEAHNNLGGVLKDCGRPAAAEACYREALRLKPDYAEAHSNLLLNQCYFAEVPPDAALAEAMHYGTLVSAAANPKFTRWHCAAEPARLKVGFVSGDFKNHPVGYFLEGLMQNLDRTMMETVAYTTTPKADRLTQRIRPLFDHWTALYGLSDRDAARRIHADAPHILIDLAGHTALNRLPVFAWKPAPVQITWLGYCATTGLPEMDHVLGDPLVTPPTDAGHFTESILRLPETYLCFTPPATNTAVNALPAQQNGFVTFGSFNNLSKAGSEVLAVWAAVLTAVPGSKLFLRAKQLQDAAVASALTARFRELGIAADRLLLEGHTATRDGVFSAYNRVDIALDPFPYPGVTTSVEALWMGVPVLTLRGHHLLSRNGETIARNAGLADWIAADSADYVAKARFFASDLAALERLRQGLRAQLQRSPLLDAPRFARHFERSMLELWQNRPRESAVR